MRACTVIAAAELPYARVLAGSLGSVALTALVLDDPADALRDDEPFSVLRPGDLEGVEPWQLLGISQRAATRYLEPRLLAHLGEAVLVACDVLVLEPLDALPGDYVTVVPRVLEPIASEAVLADGLFDSGLIGAGADAAPVLEWWREREDERLRTEAGGPHVLDAAAELFPDLHVLRDPTYGVAPWNLHERELEGARSFRFTGLDPASPHTLGDRTLEGPLADLCEDYAARLRAAGWVERGEDEGEPLARLANGVPVDAVPARRRGRRDRAGGRPRRPHEPRRCARAARVGQRPGERGRREGRHALPRGDARAPPRPAGLLPGARGRGRRALRALGAHRRAGARGSRRR